MYGQRGMFLASLASLSLLTITSHHELNSTTNTVAFHHSRPILRLIPAPFQHRLECHAHGTRVTVHDLFGNMPVRVKHRALSFIKSDDLDREWESLKMMLSGLLLAVGKAVKVVVSSSDKSRKLTFRCHSENLGEGDNLVEDTERQNGFDLERALTVLSQAGYINPLDFASWVTVSARTPALSIVSAISVEPSPTKQVQFISFGIHPALPQNNANLIYEEINRIFTLSSFGNVEDCFEPVDCDAGSRSETGKQLEANGTTKRKLKGGGKGVNRWPMFYIRINARDLGRGRTLDKEATLESDRSLQIILDVLGTMMRNFLEQHHFRPRARKRVRWSKTDSPPPNLTGREAGKTDRTKRNISSFMDLPQRSKPPKTTESFLDSRARLPSFSDTTTNHPIREFGGWSRIKSGTKNSFDDLCSGLPRGKDSSSTNRSLKRQRVVGSDAGNSADGATGTPSTPATIQPNRPPSTNRSEMGTNLCGQKPDDISDQAIYWTDPLTKTTILINSRTGQVMPPALPNSTSVLEVPRRPCSTGSFYRCSRSVGNNRPKPIERSGSDSWVENLLRKWESPIFPQSEKPIPSVSVDASNMLPPDRKFCGIKLPPSTKYKGKLTKSALRQAKVIAQVDHKFVLVRMIATPEDDVDDSQGQEQILVLIDQHAADERCRIEQLFRDMCQPYLEKSEESRSRTKVQTTKLSKPLLFQISPQEVRLFESYINYFASWGCLYKLSTNARQTTSVAITELPTLIAERCRLEPKLAIDMLRGEVWAREEGSRKSLRSSSSTPGLLNAFLTTGSELEDAIGSKDGDVNWLERITHCPQGIVDMLNSRSCRSAIMFNDVLSLEECEQLVTRLSHCAFPFQCAHGRPSMVPVVNLGSPGATGNLPVDGKLGVFGSGHSNYPIEEDDGSQLDFGRAFRNWQGV